MRISKPRHPHFSAALFSQNPLGLGWAGVFGPQPRYSGLPIGPLVNTQGLHNLDLLLFQIYFLSLSLLSPLLAVEGKLLRIPLLTHKAGVQAGFVVALPTPSVSGKPIVLQGLVRLTLAHEVAG